MAKRKTYKECRNEGYDRGVRDVFEAILWTYDFRDELAPIAEEFGISSDEIEEMGSVWSVLEAESRGIIEISEEEEGKKKYDEHERDSRSNED